jgi:cytochrome c-type biogenesis protein CcsB
MAYFRNASRLLKTLLTLGLVGGTLAVIPSQASAFDVSDVERLAIQDGGRIKPFDTFAKESVQLITGTKSYQGKNATELVLAWLFFPDQWKDQKFVQVKHLQLKEDLMMKPDESFISPVAVIQNPKLAVLITEVAQLQREKKRLNPLHQAIQRLNNQLMLYQEIIAGRNIRLVPQSLSSDWIPLIDFKDQFHDQFSEVVKAYFAGIAKNDSAGFKKAVTDFKNIARAAAPAVYPPDSQLEAEITYNNMHPFRLAYILYLVAAILFTFSLKFPASKTWHLAALATTVIGFTVHIIGFGFRCYLAGRPPVSNMYESIIWVALGCVFFGLILELIYKRRYIGLAATVVATLALIVGDSAPAVLDQSIKPLEPVLRSNLWLTIHVLTITLSYAAFALATGIGNIAMSYYARGIEKQNSEKLQALALFCYRAMQVGVLLLTAGTILGGVWADYSWGRFWGWDPKETWALIADLGYLAVLHGRFTGWLRTFGTLAAAIVAFSGVVFAWYGVNFVLGVGLHSYGFGGGGVHYVTIAMGIQLLYVAWAGFQHQRIMKQGKAAT